uniref:ABC transporter n=2 Tax=Serratia TaxID=613 RepID=UPI001BD38C29
RGSRPQRRFRHRHAVALANRQSLLGEGKLDFAWLMQRRQWLDMAAVSARNAALMSHLAHCSAQLDQVVEPLHRAGVPVLLAPMHTVSDVLATLVGAGVYPGRATVIVSGDVQAFARRSPEDEWRQRLDYCSIHDDPRHIAGTLSQAMLEAAEHRRNIILFPDITPDYTLHSNQDVAAKLACHLFGRPAHLHSGIVRLSRALRAQVVFYSLYFDRGIRIHIEEPVAADRVGRVMPAIVERTLRRHADDWLLWHSHSLFFINE